MKTLRDQLLKAGLVDKKQVQKAQHDKRVERKKKGLQQIEEEKQQKKHKWLEQKELERTKQQEIAQKQQEKVDKKEQWTQCLNIINQAALKTDWTGNRKFYFVTRQKSITYLYLSEPIALKLEKGQLAIVEIPGTKYEQFALINAQTALKVKSMQPDYVLFFNL